MVQKEFDISIARDIERGERFGTIKTKNGDKVRVLCYNAKGLLPVVGLIDKGEYEIIRAWTITGKSDWRPKVHTSLDLVIELEGGES